MLEIVWNSEEKRLADILNVHISQADRIDIAVAFLNCRGLSLIESELWAALGRGCTVRLFVGTDFCLTDPKAFRRLENAFRQQGESKLFLVGQSTRSTFHPKVYVFESDDQITVILGSANLTHGGLGDNWEACCVCTDHSSSELQHMVNLMFCQYEAVSDVKEATIWEIERYAAQYRKFRKYVKPAEKQAAKEIKAIPTMDESRLRACLEQYGRNKEQQEDYQKREVNYQKARELLDQLASGSITDETQFRAIWERLIGKTGRLWFSDSMYRRGYEAVHKFPQVCQLVRAIRDNAAGSPQELFELGQRFVSRIAGIGPNVLTEIMNTYYPDRCAVLNGNPLASLRYFGISDFPVAGSFKGSHYGRYNDVITYIKDLLGLESMGHADHFLSFVYFKIKREEHSGGRKSA